MASQSRFFGRVRRELRYYRAILNDPDAPRLAKWCIAAGLAYLFSPFDLVPDVFPVIGQLDDLIVVSTLIGLGLSLVPMSVKQDARRRTRPILGRSAETRTSVLFETEALPGSFGVRVTDFDLGRGDMDEAVASILELTWEHHVVILDQRVINAEAFQHHTRSLGGLVPAEQRNICQVDVSRDDESAEFIDVMAAYEALPPAEKERIDSLRIGSYFGAIGGADEDDNSVLSFPFRVEFEHQGAPTAIRPLVRTHPLTGRRSLGLPILGGSRIIGISEEESVELIARLEEHALQPRFRYVHSYRAGDLMAWDSHAAFNSRLPAAETGRGGLLRAFGFSSH